MMVNRLYSARAGYEAIDSVATYLIIVTRITYISNGRENLVLGDFFI